MSASTAMPAAPRQRVSRGRRAVSAVVLVVVGGVLLIELHAAIGHAQSAKALTALAPEGVFENATLDDVAARVRGFPKESIVRSNADEKVMAYHWQSLLRPLIGQPELTLFVVATPDDPARAIAYFTDAEDAATGFYGDKAPAQDAAEIYERMNVNSDPFGIPDAPVEEPQKE